jgi:branched-chain amino acid transport system ATP-binding protein
MLELDKVTVNFAGLRAVNAVSLTVTAGSIVGLIGPNGAGKTTLFNVITGMVRPSSGRVRFAGHDITRLGPAARSRCGIARTFQIVRPFSSLSVRDNVVVAALTRKLSVGAARTQAEALLAQLELSRFAQATAGSLPLALRKRLELARALATQPRLLLLDEVMGGLIPSEIDETLALIAHLRHSGMTIVMVEHNMRAIAQITDRVVVLKEGALLCEGSAFEVARDPQVIATYLGAPDDAA